MIFLNALYNKAMDMQDGPRSKRGARLINTVYFLLLLVWMPIEGNLLMVTIFGGATALWLTFHLISYLTRWQTAIASFNLLIWGGIGLINGLMLPPIILMLMGLKTGLHAHGPEFTPVEIAYILSRFVPWGGLGLLGGLGWGMMRQGWRRLRLGG